MDGRDEESGQYTAAIKQTVFSGAKDAEAEANRQPRPGDQIIVSPFLSSRELRMEGYNPQQEVQQDAPRQLPEIEDILTPVP